MVGRRLCSESHDTSSKGFGDVQGDKDVSSVLVPVMTVNYLPSLEPTRT